MGWAWQRSLRLWRAQAARPSSSPRSARPQELRALLPDATIYVFAGLHARTRPLSTAQLDLAPRAQQRRRDRGVGSILVGARRELPAAMHIDSGMNRLGLQPPRSRPLRGAKSSWHAFELALVMSHLACADEPEHAEERGAAQDLRRPSRQIAEGAGKPRQLRRHPARARLSLRPRPPRHRPLRRQGFPRRAPTDLPAVVQLSGRVLQVRDVPRRRDRRLRRDAHAETPLARRHPLRWDMPTASSARCRSRMAEEGLQVYFGSHPAPLLGRVSMDLITVDVTDVPERACPARRLGRADRHPRRRSRPCRSCRHHRLRGPHQSRHARLRGAIPAASISSWPKPPKPSSAKPVAR